MQSVLSWQRLTDPRSLLAWHQSPPRRGKGDSHKLKLKKMGPTKEQAKADAVLKAAAEKAAAHKAAYAAAEKLKKKHQKASRSFNKVRQGCPFALDPQLRGY